MKNFQRAMNFETIMRATGKSDGYCENIVLQAEEFCDVTEPLVDNLYMWSEVSGVDERVLEECYGFVKPGFERIADNTQIIRVGDDLWPADAKGVYYLYLQGNASLLEGRGLCVVGTREPSTVGVENTKRIVSAVGEAGLSVVSGLALGIDGVAHLTALKKGIPTVAVIGTPVVSCYPKEHLELQKEIAKTGLVVSQFGPSRDVQRYYFMMRNLLMANIGCGTAIVESKDGGGGVSQANYSRKDGKPVYILKEVYDNRSILWPRKMTGAVILPNPQALAKELQKNPASAKVEDQQPSLF